MSTRKILPKNAFAIWLYENHILEFIVDCLAELNKFLRWAKGK